jgi:hypothetical protein
MACTQVLSAVMEVRQNHKCMPGDFHIKTLKLKLGDKGQNNSIYMLINIHKPPVQGNFCDEHIKPQKLNIAED